MINHPIIMIKRYIILFVFLCTIIIVMSLGLFFDIRLITLFKRIFFSITIAVVSSCLIGIIIEKYIKTIELSTQENKLNDTLLQEEKETILESQENGRS